MKKLFIAGVLLVLFSSCKKETVSKEPVVYQPSEMAALMNRMYEENAKIKQQILNGETPENFPEEYLKIHTATLTDPSDRTSQFRQYSDLYLNNLRDIFETPKDSLKLEFNEVINSCIACHQTTCIGPIPRIRKLLIR